MATPTADQPRYLSVVDAASYIGVSPTTLRRLIDADAVKALRPSPRRVVLDRQQLDAYLAQTAPK